MDWQALQTQRIALVLPYVMQLLTNRLQEAGDLRQPVAKELSVIVEMQGQLCSCTGKVLLQELLVPWVDLHKTTRLFTSR